jgi:hypothetical protein
MKEQDDFITISTGTYNWSALDSMHGNTSLGGSSTITAAHDPNYITDVCDTYIRSPDILVGGKSLVKSLDAIEGRLAILFDNPELEARWDQLRDLKSQYDALEKDILEQEKLMRILK